MIVRTTNHFYNNPKFTVNILTETLLKEFIPTPWSIFEFENRRKRIIIWTFSHVQPINIPSHVEAINIPVWGTQSENAPSKKNFLKIIPPIQTIGEFKSVVFEKDEMEYKDISILKKILPILVNQDSNSEVETNIQDI